MSTAAPEALATGRWRAALPWGLGALLALLVAGPALGPGLLLNLDLVVTHDPPVPAGVWGLGPELPRGLPYQVPLAWLSTLLDGALVSKVLLVAIMVVAFVGAHRLARGAPPAARAAAGMIYAGGPFLVTRLAIGHIGTAAAAALLPWALPTLLRPGDSLRRTLLWSAALGFWGVNGGILAGAAVITGLIADRGRRGPQVAAAFAVGQLPWLVPGIVVTLQGVDPAGAENFATRLDGALGFLRVAGGQGYFIEAFDVGGDQLVVPVAALVLVVAAIAGRRRLPDAWGRRSAALAAAGFVVVVASGLPGLDGIYRLVADTPIGLPLREGQRVLPLCLVWLTVAGAHGAGRLGERFEGAGLVALGAALALVGPSLWGFGGQLEPVRQPTDWAEARRAVRAGPGPVLALPFTQYVRPDLLDGHLVHQPLPYLFGGDVLVASGRADPDGPSERADQRLAVAGALAARLRSGQPAEAEIAALGIRWVAVLRTVDADPPDLVEAGLRRVVAGPDLVLYEVEDWTGPALDDLGAPVELEPIISPYLRAATSGPATWFRSGGGGWLRGLDTTEVSPAGNLTLPAGSGPIWYWPSLLVLAADGVALGAVVAARRRDR